MSRNQNGEADVALAGLPALPPGWCWTTVGEIGHVQLGRQRSPKNRSNKYPTKYLRAANITWLGLDLSDVLEMEFRPEELKTYRLQKGDVLLSEASGSAGEVGKPAVWNEEFDLCCFQNTVIRFRPILLPPSYPLVVFMHFARNGIFASLGKGIGIHHLGAERFSQMHFPLAPLNEQGRIVAKIEELFSGLDAGVLALERVKTNLKRYRAAVLQAAVTGKLTETWRAKYPGTETASDLLERILTERRRKWEEEQLARYAESDKEPPKGWQAKYTEPAGPDVGTLPDLPKGWCWVRLNQLISFLRNGLSHKPVSVPSSSRILRINAVRPMRVDLEEARYLESPLDEFSEYMVENHDLLFTRYNGSVDLLGVAGMVRGCLQPTLHPDKLIRVKTVLGWPLPAFIEIACNVGVSRKHMESRARTTAGQTGISGADIREMPIPLPPLTEQEEIVAEVERRLSVIEEVEAQVETNLRRAARLRQCILKRAFEGRLVPQEPTDEPADKLLERIRQERTARNGETKPPMQPRGRRPRRKKADHVADGPGGTE